MNQFTARDDHFHGTRYWFHHISLSWIETSAGFLYSLPQNLGELFCGDGRMKFCQVVFCVRLISRKGKDDKTNIKHRLYGLYGLYSINHFFSKIAK